MKRVFLVYPPSAPMNREGRCQQPLKDLVVIPPLPPVELMYLASVAREAGWEPKIKDYSLKSETLEDFTRDLKEFNPDYLLVNVTTPTLETDINACCVAKVVNPNIKIIVTGAYFLTFDKEILEKSHCIDFIIRGESEETFREILEGRLLNEILGLTYRDNDIVKSNSERPFIENLDSLPFPARDLVDNDFFKRPDNNKVQAIIKVSRGCPYHCFFCLATEVSGSKVRMRSPKNIVDEIIECVEKYKITNFVFWSDVFDFDKKWVLALCEEIKDSNLHIVWSANTRADLVNEELVDAMYKAGCRLVSMGVESGSQDILDKMGKNITLSQVREAVKLFKKHKIKIYNYFVLGLPWETERDIKKTIDFAIELDSEFVSFYTATALPGTKFYHYIKDTGLGDLSGKDVYSDAYYFPNVPTHSLSKDKIFELHKYAVKKYYLRPSYIIKRLFGIRSLSEFFNYFKAGIGLLLKK